jgi:hypothetical protein
MCSNLHDRMKASHQCGRSLMIRQFRHSDESAKLRSI